MARPPRFRATKRKGGQGWLVNVTAAHAESGKREQRYFKTREKAQDFAAQLREQVQKHGEQAGSIPPALAEQATAAARLLKDYDVTLLEVVRRFVEAEEAAKASMKIEEVVASYRRAKEHLSDKQQQAIRLLGNHLVEDFAGRKISTIRTGEITAHLEERTSGAGAYNAKRRLMRTLWRWAARPPRNWCDPGVVDAVELQRSAGAEIGILGAGEVERLLRTAETEYPDAVPGFAISVFTGLRKAELERLAPADVTEEGIRIPASASKMARRRFVNMPPPLRAWLDAYPVGESVLPMNWSRKDRAVRRLAGWRVWADLVDPAEPPETLPAWPHNAIRHTHATVAVATGAPIEQLVFEFGHSGGHSTLMSHYVGAMPRGEALKILQIGPHGRKLPTMQVA